MTSPVDSRMAPMTPIEEVIHCANVTIDDGGECAKAAQAEYDALRSALTAAQRENDGLQAACRQWNEQFDAKDAALQQARSALTAAEKRAQEADSDCDKALEERDEAVEMCDKLAARIADMDDLDIGEHSSGNCPWQNALDGISQEPT